MFFHINHNKKLKNRSNTVINFKATSLKKNSTVVIFISDILHMKKEKELNNYS